MRLDCYDRGDYTPGAPLWKQVLWYYLGDAVVRSRWLPITGLKAWVLRRFGAVIGRGVRIKSGVQVKFPWRLRVGDYVWIGENAWIDNLAPVTLGNHVCLSQDVYLCTGNHDWSSPSFRLRCAPIVVEEGSWLAARSVVGPGVTVGRGAVLTLGSVSFACLEPMTIYRGNPARRVKERQFVAAGAEPQGVA